MSLAISRADVFLFLGNQLKPLPINVSLVSARDLPVDRRNVDRRLRVSNADDIFGGHFELSSETVHF